MYEHKLFSIGSLTETGNMYCQSINVDASSVKRRHMTLWADDLHHNMCYLVEMKGIYYLNINVNI